MMQEDRNACGYCGHTTSEPLNRYGVHDYCVHDSDRDEDDKEN